MECSLVASALLLARPRGLVNGRALLAGALACRLERSDTTRASAGEAKLRLGCRAVRILGGVLVA